MLAIAACASLCNSTSRIWAASRTKPSCLCEASCRNNDARRRTFGSARCCLDHRCVARLLRHIHPLCFHLSGQFKDFLFLQSHQEIFFQLLRPCVGRGYFPRDWVGPWRTFKSSPTTAMSSNPRTPPSRRFNRISQSWICLSSASTQQLNIWVSTSLRHSSGTKGMISSRTPSISVRQVEKLETVGVGLYRPATI